MKTSLKLSIAWIATLLATLGLGLLAAMWMFLGFSDEPLNGSEKLQHEIGTAIFKVFIAPCMALPAPISQYLAQSAWLICSFIWTTLLMLPISLYTIKNKAKEPNEAT